MKTTHKRKVSVKGQPRCCQKVRHCKHMKISQKRNAGTRAAHSKPAVFLDTSVYTVQDTPHSFSGHTAACTVKQGGERPSFQYQNQKLSKNIQSADVSRTT